MGWSQCANPSVSLKTQRDALGPGSFRDNDVCVSSRASSLYLISVGNYDLEAGAGALQATCLVGGSDRDLSWTYRLTGWAC